MVSGFDPIFSQHLGTKHIKDACNASCLDNTSHKRLSHTDVYQSLLLDWWQSQVKKSLIVILDDWLNNLKPVWQAAVATGMKIRQSPVRNPPEKNISPQTAWNSIHRLTKDNGCSLSASQLLLHSDFLTKTFLIQIIIKMSQRLKLSWRHQLDWKDFNASETPQKSNGRKILNNRSKNRFKDNFFSLKIELKLQLEFLSNFFSTPF